jgi:hypothetical protein
MSAGHSRFGASAAKSRRPRSSWAGAPGLPLPPRFLPNARHQPLSRQICHPVESRSSMSTVEPALQARRRDTEVLRDLGDGRIRVEVDLDHFRSELPGEGLRHGAHPSSAEPHRRRSDVTVPCSSPIFIRQGPPRHDPPEVDVHYSPRQGPRRALGSPHSPCDSSSPPRIGRCPAIIRPWSPFEASAGQRVGPSGWPRT